MQIQVDHLKAEKILAASLVKAAKPKYKTLSAFAPLLKLVIAGDHLTYRYVLLTALLAKAVDEKVNPLALQAGGKLDGSYDARSLCHKVFVPFEREFLDNGLGGSNEPFLNKPARFTHISSTNAVRGGNDRKTLELLCKLLPEIKTSTQGKNALSDAIFYTLKRGAENRKLMGGAIAINSNRLEILEFIEEFTASSFDGETCALAVGAMLDCWGSGYSNEFRVKVHPVNQSGASSNEISDIDAFEKGNLVVTVEVKDKIFSSHDVGHAVKKVKAEKFDTLIFVKGPNGKLIDNVGGKQAVGDENRLMVAYRKEGFLLKFYTIAEIAEMLLALMTPTSRASFVVCLFKHAGAARVKDETRRHIQVTATGFGWLPENT